SIQRIYVKSSLYNEFMEEFINKAKELKLGDPADEATDISVLIQPSETDRLEDWIREAVQGGAQVAYGGNRQGNILEPTVITDASSDLSVNCKEVFGPIVTIEPYEELDEAIAKVNDSNYGLQAGIYTTDVGTAFKASDKIEA